jgi:phosphatidylglycerol:prolipoprotein diacylglycerol transferase
MNSILVDLGIFKISWYSILILLGVFIGGSLTLREAKRFNLDKDYIVNLIFWTVIVGIIGARLYYVAFNWSYYVSNFADIFKTWEGGLAIHGAIIGTILVLLYYSKKYKVPTLLLTDIMCVSVILGQAIGRWGNFFNQEAHGGVVTRSFLEGLHIPTFIIDGMNIYGVYYHPTFLYESLWCLLGFIALLIIRRYRYIKLGQLTGIYFMWYSVGRFFIEALRTDSLMLGDFKMAQVVSVGLFVIGMIIVGVSNKGGKFDNLYNKEGVVNDVKF